MFDTYLEHARNGIGKEISYLLNKDEAFPDQNIFIYIFWSENASSLFNMFNPGRASTINYISYCEL